MAGFDDAGVKVQPHFLGHRERLKDRFANGGPDAMPDYELLEMVLFRAIRRGDTKPIAKQLLARFGHADTAGRARQKLNAKLSFQPPHGVADSGLRCSKPGSCAGEAALLCNHDKCRKIAKLGSHH